MSWQIIHLAQTPPSPWRNGGGVTRELIAWPDANDWAWRMSVAEVASNGVLSKFEGVQRWFAV
ncbi:MAG: HutD family protein [Burkholderiaceae bacterium]|nr:HutD family protein [Burkholderiaceae bacterium]